MLAQRSWSGMSPIRALVEQACDPTLPEPNHAVNIELSDLINSKKANSARDASRALLVHVNSRNPNQSLLALSVIEHLVRNCGYPMHLQISTKEFLNELVRRFPERPPMVTGRVMGRILELIHEWKNTLCVHSKYKEDLVHIRDMHRLLSYKGYRFKSFDAARAMASANPNEDLKSPEELEEEDRAAKSAKLQELIRRGSPRDLAAAQELMKYLSGAEPDKAVDYTAKTLSELDKVQSKAILLNDMLNNAREGEKIGLEGDVYEQVAAACKGARPKIQKWIEQDDGEKADMMDRLLLCNDLINNALDRYEAVKAGDWGKAQALVESANPNKKAADLISFDAFADEAPLSGDGSLSLGPDASSSSTSGASLSSGLPLDLFSAPSPAPSPGFGSSTAPRQDPMAFFRQQPQTMQQPPQQQQQHQQSQQQQFGGLSAPQSAFSSHSGSSTPVGGMAGVSQFGSFGMQQAPPGYSMSPQPPQQRQQQPQQPFTSQPPQQQRNGQQPPKKDAFADLVDLMG